MSSDKPIPINTTQTAGSFVAPTPQNTPMVSAPIGGGLSKPTVPDIAEALEELDIDDDEDDDDDDGEGDMNDPVVKAAMLEMVQGRLAGLVGKSSGYIENLPLAVKKRIEGLKGVHWKYMKLELEYRKELLELDKKYQALYDPVFDRRQKIIAGEAEPTDEEVKKGEEQSMKDDPDAEPLDEMKDKHEGGDVKGIPDFWLTALRNHMEITELITERDEAAIKHLTDIRLEYLPGQQGFKLYFHFSPNEFFSNTVLSKTYYYESEEDEPEGGWDYDRAEGTKIEWKADMDLTKEIEIRKQRNRNTNRTRTVKKAKDVPSFFTFFEPPIRPDEDAVENGDMEEEEFELLMFKLQDDFDLGEDFKDKIIPRAIDWFTGKALEYDPDIEDDDDEDDYDEGGHDDDDDEDSDEAPAPKKKTGKTAAAGGESEECKNQ